MQNKLRFEELKAKYCNKYFRVLTDENRNIMYLPDKHELIYIKDLYKYFPESEGRVLVDYMHAVSKAIDEGFVNIEEEKKKWKENPETAEEFNKRISEHYNLPIKKYTESIEVSSGVSIQYITNLGECGGTLKSIGAVVFPCEDLEEISKEEFDTIYGYITSCNEDIKKFIENL